MGKGGKRRRPLYGAAAASAAAKRARLEETATNLCPPEFKINNRLSSDQSTLEMSKYGLLQVHDWENAKVDIVFLHGLRGDIEQTWTKNGVIWPKVLLRKDVPESRIFLFGFQPSIAHGDVANTEIQSNAEDLCSNLAAMRSSTKTVSDLRIPDSYPLSPLYLSTDCCGAQDNRPIIFIAHSLGGLVAAQVLVYSEQRTENSSAKSITRNLRGMIFLGTPFRGSSAMKLAEIASRILRFFGVDIQQHALKRIGADSEHLDELTKVFLDVLNKRKASKDPESKIEVFFFYETMTTWFNGSLVQLVESESAQLPGCGETAPIHADHDKICKFEKDEDVGYGEIVEAINKVMSPLGAWPSQTIHVPGKAVNISRVPIPIIINGNRIDPSTTSPAPDASNSNYILVQSRKRLTPSQRRELADADLVLHDYVSKNTYLYSYQGVSLDKIRQMDPVVYVDVYRLDFKIPPSLKEAVPDFPYQVDVAFHKDVDSDSKSLRALIAEKSHLSEGDIKFFPHKSRLTILGQYVNEMASIDKVCRIEKVGKVVLRNNEARLVLGANVQLGPVITPYQGEGQTIAIADTGLDTGQIPLSHPAFQNRVRHLYPLCGDAADSNGHGTHVCGSAVGNDLAGAGTAPQASLVVQCLGGDLSALPDDLTELFKNPYDDYARAIEIDGFVHTHPEMVICWAAGNDAADPNGDGVISQGQIGAEAAAKNCITVGASENNRPNAPYTYGWVWPQFPKGPVHSRHEAINPSRVADFSSRGPTREGRVKPDLVSPGTCILSANSGLVQNPERPSPSQHWCYMSGTSMSTPLVAGCAAVIRESLMKNGTFHPSAALIKALLINGADILPNQPIPSFESGFGRVNLANSIAAASGKEGTAFHEGRFGQYNEKAISIRLDVERECTLKATLVWCDPPSAMIQNRLVLELEHEKEKRRVYDDDDYDENLNNVQQILWQNIPRGNITVTVEADDTLKLPQPFAVVWRLY
ncbi:Peptidase S8/S53 domain containing protein [Elaphomyces granulatus]